MRLITACTNLYTNIAFLHIEHRVSTNRNGQKLSHASAIHARTPATHYYNVHKHGTNAFTFTHANRTRKQHHQTAYGDRAVLVLKHTQDVSFSDRALSSIRLTKHPGFFGSCCLIIPVKDSHQIRTKKNNKCGHHYRSDRFSRRGPLHRRRRTDTEHPHSASSSCV